MGIDGMTTSYLMRPARFDLDTLRGLLEPREIASLPELKGALGSAVAMTVFSKLAALLYLGSYSHRGAYYRSLLHAALQLDRGYSTA